MAISTFEADEVVARANVNQRINQANAYFPVSVPNGGTGKTSFTSGDILVGNGTGGIDTTNKLSVSKGGTGQTSFTSGEILLGNGTNGITSTSILPVSKGGTGVNDFCQAGEWTPALGNVPAAATVNYISRSGNYIKIGSMVYITLRISFSITNFPSGYSSSAIISGLPFVSYSGTYPLATSSWKNVFGDYNTMVGVAGGNSIYPYTLDNQMIYYTSNVSDALLGFFGWYKIS